MIELVPVHFFPFLSFLTFFPGSKKSCFNPNYVQFHELKSTILIIFLKNHKIATSGQECIKKVG